MISVGNNIQCNADPLQKASVSYLAERVINPQSHIKEKIARLRLVRDIDGKQYRQLKKELPYFVCGRFAPEFRRTENFAYTEYFIVDLDHLSKFGLTASELKQKLSKDNRIHLMFTSPGEDGVKVLYKLSDKCYDAGIYSVFYKAFVNHLGETYNIAEIIDYATHDVTRACFISWDPDAYHNPLADTVDLNAFLDLNNPLAMFEMKKELEQQIKDAPVISDESEKVSEPSDDIMERIKAKLKERQIKTSKNADVFVPEQIERIIDDLTTFFEQFEITLYETKNIQYGKKLRFRLEKKYAELNLFFGKRGFTVVESPKTGTDIKLNQLCADIVKQFLSEMR